MAYEAYVVWVAAGVVWDVDGAVGRWHGELAGWAEWSGVDVMGGR